MQLPESCHAEERGISDSNNEEGMVILNKHLYFTYILTNPERTVLYIGITNNLEARITEHYFNRGKLQTFAGKYYCYLLIYYEEFQYIKNAIAREKEIKGWRRSKKKLSLKPKTLIGLL